MMIGKIIKNTHFMKKLLLTAVISLLCATSINAQDCKLCGVWSGAYKDEYPSGDQYRVKVEFTIESPKKLKYSIKAGSGWPHWVKSDDIFFVDDECNDYRIKYYTKVIDDDWGGEKFKGRKIGYCTINSYFVLEVGEEENTLILRSLGQDSFYYDEYGNYIGKEWSECEAISCVCVLHQLED
jgi:hypothetical protein